MANVDNHRPGSLYDLEVQARSKQAIVQIAQQSEVIKLYFVVSAGASKFDSFLLASSANNAGQTVEITTTITYYDATQRTATGYFGPQEVQSSLYELDLT